jgi:hypothetical protein
LKDFGRDNLWHQLKQDSNISSVEWTNLFLDKIFTQLRDLKEVEPSINFLLQLPLPWPEIMDYLRKANLKMARLLKTKEPNDKHIILLNPKNQDYLLYLCLKRTSADTCKIDFYSASREGIREPVEYEHINDIINTILHYIWKSALDT